MLRDIINEALIENRFLLSHTTNNTIYYICKNKNEVRFAVLHEISELTDPEELNSNITSNAPDNFISDPSFKKNCDLICTVKLGSLSDFKEIEDQIFRIEEDPYQYKKYVLYYSDSEENLVERLTFKELIATISDKQLFDEYKANPLAPSMYGIAAKLFIKLPFLELPFKKRELVPLVNQAQEAVNEANLKIQYELIQSNKNIENIITELIAYELENIKN